ncbi:YjgN family protein [Tenacibaculum sp. UWU-22]|uniref:YjgN family protein n=1 Tax=Tenacibaculum sp. UWU-22 TaxID=3234187 RepID=UPI0034DB26C8
MEVIPNLNPEKKQFNYFGKGSEFAIIYFKNILLTIFTLGIYYPWAKVEILKYYYQSTELDNSRFSFTGTGKEVFKGFVKVYAILIFLFIFLTYTIQSKSQTLVVVGFSLFYLFVLLVIPFAIHGAARYRASRSAWKGIHFKYLGNRMELFWKCLGGFLLTIFTLGIYTSWFTVDIRKYIISHLRFGNLSFDFKGKGETLFWINLKFILLLYPTLGIYTLWYQKNLWNFYAKNTEITQNGRKIDFNFTMKAGDVFELYAVNFLLIVFTLGIATPWVIMRTFKFIFRFLYIEEGLDTESIQQVSYDDYDDASGDDFLDFLDFDFI